MPGCKGSVCGRCKQPNRRAALRQLTSRSTRRHAGLRARCLSPITRRPPTGAHTHKANARAERERFEAKERERAREKERERRERRERERADGGGGGERDNPDRRREARPRDTDRSAIPPNNDDAMSSALLPSVRPTARDRFPEVCLSGRARVLAAAGVPVCSLTCAELCHVA